MSITTKLGPKEDLSRHLFEKLRHLEVVEIRWYEEGAHCWVIRFELADGRWCEVRVEPEFFAPADYGRHVDWLVKEANNVLTRAFHACIEHEDCKKHPLLGAACWEATYGKERKGAARWGTS